jgi:hypothetical protein
MADTVADVHSVWDDIVTMLKTPFVGNLDVVHLFMLVGIVLVFIALWVVIFNKIVSVSQEV